MTQYEIMARRNVKRNGRKGEPKRERKVWMRLEKDESRLAVTGAERDRDKYNRWRHKK